MSKTLFSGTVRILCAALAVLLCAGDDSHAASGQWTVASSGRERVTLRLDVPDQVESVTISGPRTLSVNLKTPAAGFSVPPVPAQALLFTGASSAGARIDLALSTPAFGYIVLKPNLSSLIVDVYPDPLGMRRNVPETASSLPAQTGASAAQAAESPSAAAASPDARLPPETRAAPENTAPAAENEPDRNARISPQSIRASINREGPEAWPSARGISSGEKTPQSAVSPAAPKRNAAAAPAASSLQAQAVPVAPGRPRPSPESPASAQTEAPSVSAPPEPAGAASPRPVSAKKSSLPPLPEHLRSPASAQPPPPPEREAPAPATPESPPPAPPAARPAPDPSDAPAGPSVMGQITAPRQTANATAKVSANATADGQAAPVIYVDEKGNPVPKPVDPNELMTQAETAMARRDYKAALDTLTELKALTIPREQREKALYMISDANWELYKDKGLEGYEAIISSTNEAMNADLRSPNVPNALLRLGEANLLVDNLREAEAYFRARRSAHPPGPEVPMSFLKLGLALAKNGQHDKAVGIFRDIIRNFPESPAVRSASIALGTSLAAVKDMKEAAIVLDFADKRWPRHYLEDPPFLLVQAQASLWQNKLREALQQYWLYYNLEPKKDGNDKILLAIGDLYLRLGRPAQALEVYEGIIQRYPDSEGAQYSLVRLAEKSIHDGPALNAEEMYKVFADPGAPAPNVAYRKLADESPESPIGILSSLKLTLWHLWNKHYADAVRAAAEYIDLHPEEPGATTAREVILRSFDEEIQQDLREENYGRILILWNGFPLIREKNTPLSDDLRTALAKGHLERGEDAAAVELLAHFLKTPKNAEYGDYAFTFFFNKHLGAGDWNAVLELGETVAAWDFAPRMRNELDYALALSAENLGLPGRALSLWRKLAPKNDIPLYQKAYATYFLAKDAERRRDIKDAYAHNKASLELFTRLGEEQRDKADPERVKEVVTSLMDICEVSERIPEALEWLEFYNAFAPEGSPEYAGLRFREARLYRKLADNAKSRALLEQIVRADPDSPFGKAAASELRTFDVSRDLDRFTPGQ